MHHYVYSTLLFHLSSLVSVMTYCILSCRLVMRDADIRSTECTKRVRFTRTRFQYEFKLATVFWLKLLLVSNALNSFLTRRHSVTIRHCVLFTVSYQRNAAHGTQGLCCYLTVPTHLTQAWPPQLAESNSETAHCTVLN